MGMSGKQLRRMALALEGTSEAPHFDKTAFKATRTYATLAADGRSANLKFAPDDQHFICMMQPDAFAIIPNGWGRMGWTEANLSRLTAADLRAALAMAWRHATERRPRRKARGH